MKAELIDKIPTNRAWLQFSSKRIEPEKVQVDYELVIPLNEVDCRGTFDHKGKKKRPISHRIVWLDENNSKRIPLGRTIVGTGYVNYPMARYAAIEGQLEVELPFRDGAHCSWDNDKLGLQIYYVTEAATFRLIPERAKS